MIEKSSGAACALALVLAGGSAQAEDLQLTPSSAWVVDYADDSCALRRTFGDPEQRVWLELRQFAPGDEFLVTTASATLGVVKSVPKSTFEPDGPSREQSLAAFGAYGEASEGISFPDSLRPNQYGTRPPRGKWDEADRDARERAISGLRLTSAFSRDVVLATGAMHEPMAAMRTCMDDLLTEWGINPAVERTLSKPARPMNMRNWVPTIRQHFPTGLIVLGRDARVTLRLIVDAEGKQSACRVLRPVVDKSYENLICGILLERAKFAPALDAAGQPVQSLYVSSVVYR